MKRNKLDQIVGDNSTSLQVGRDVHVTHGIQYSDVKEIAMDVFKSNFYDLGEKVQDIINSRAEEIINKFLDKLKAQFPESLSNTEDPDVRYAIYNSQKNHARRGDVDIADLIVEVLVERTKVKDEALLKLVTNESLEVIPKLTLKQIDILTVLFIFRYVNIKEVFPTLVNLYEIVSVFAEDIPSSEWFYQHLQFTGCISISIGSVDLEKIITDAYQKDYGIELQGYLSGTMPGFLKVLDMWQNTKLKHSSLTSVGVSIALSNFKRKIGVDWDLSLWIKE